jgi:hypothetical protein
MGERGEKASIFVKNEGGNTFLDGDRGCEGEVADARTGMGDRCENASVLSVTEHAGTYAFPKNKKVQNPGYP